MPIRYLAERFIQVKQNSQTVKPQIQKFSALTHWTMKTPQTRFPLNFKDEIPQLSLSTSDNTIPDHLRRDN